MKLAQHPCVTCHYGGLIPRHSTSGAAPRPKGCCCWPIWQSTHLSLALAHAAVVVAAVVTLLLLVTLLLVVGIFIRLRRLWEGQHMVM